MYLSSFNIDLLMAEKRLSKSKYAELCNISPQNLSTILCRGSCQPATAKKLADGLGVSVSAIVREQE